MTNSQWPVNQSMLSLREEDHTQGSLNAIIQLMEYGDYQSDRSGQAYFSVQNIQQEFGDQLCFVYRHFPPTPTPSSGWKPAEAAEAASAQGKFWEMHNALYEHQDKLDDGDLVEYAAQVDLDIPRFLREMTNHAYRDRIQEDLVSGIKNGVEDRPTFFISVRHQGAENLDVLLTKILEAINLHSMNV